VPFYMPDPGRIATLGLPRPGALSSCSKIKDSMTQHGLGRALQFLGLLVLPFAIASELSDAVGLGKSMLIAAGGAGVFYLGYVLQARTQVG